MALRVEEIRDYLIKKINSGEVLGLHEIRSLAERTDDYNEIQLMEMYSKLLENKERIPTSQEIAQEIMCQIKHFKFRAEENIVAQSILPPIYNKYKLSGQQSQELIRNAFTILIDNGYLEEKKINGQDITILTSKGFDSL